jgi:sugar lactone lactonase YvrE
MIGSLRLPSRACLRAAGAALALLTVPLFPSAAGAYPTSGLSIYTIAGDGMRCTTRPACGDGGAGTSARLNTPDAVAVDSVGNVYIADAGDNEVRKLTPAGTITTIAGSGTFCSTAPSCGDGGPATQAQLNFPEGVAVDASGDVYIADFGDNEVRKVTPAGTITTIAGNGTKCQTAPMCGDGGPATKAQLPEPNGVAFDGGGNLYIADFGDNEIRKVSAAGTITRVAGDGTACQSPPSCGDGGPATSAQLTQPTAVALDSSGDLFVADTEDHEVRKVNAAGTITTFAGTGVVCGTAPACGDGHPATSAQLWAPNALAVDGAGNLYIGDANEDEVRRVTPGGTITRVAGNGMRCTTLPTCGDGGAATSAQFNANDGVAVDASGNVYVADSNDDEIRWLTGPQAGPAGPPGTPGPPGAPGAPGAPGHDGRLVLVAYAALASRDHVTVRYALTSSAQVTLAVQSARMHRTTVARSNGHAGLGALRWNERIRGKRVRHGHYTLTITATVAGHSASSLIRVSL